MGGYPFYYYSKGSHAKTEVGPEGFQLFLEMILGPNSIDCWPNQEDYAVPLQGGYSNRLWGYGLIDGGLHEGRPLKIDDSTNIADLLDVMGYRSGGVEYLTLGLIGFACPNHNVEPDQQVGYYVHNGANWDDSDYNKGKYSMAVAAWTKISILASSWTDVYYENPMGRYDAGKVKCQVAWSYAVPPQSSTDTWKVRFVTSTIAPLWYNYGGVQLINANAPLKISGSSSETKFEFLDYQSTTLCDASETSWQNTIAQGVLWTAVAVILIPFTAGTSWVAYVVTIGLGFSQTVTALAFESPSPVTGPDYVDLALADNSEVSIQHPNGYYYKQLQSFGVTEASLIQSPNGGASETLTVKMGQKGDYYHFVAQGILTFQKAIMVEPYLSADSNQQPQTPQTPSGPDSGYRHTSYTYSTSTNDPEDDDVRYIFYWGDGSSTTTNWYETGNTVSASHQWSNPGTYQVQVQAQDCQGAYSALSSSLAVNIVNRAPNTPFPPVRIGSTTVYRNVSYTYYTSTTDPDGDDVRYQFEFTGPGLDVSPMTGWYASGQTGNITVMWENEDPLGTYQIRVCAQDVYEEWSYWSPYLTVNLVNSPPNTPSLTGTTAGYVDGTFTYKACATDPDGDSVNYTFYWADGTTTTTGYYDSGVEVSRSHSWSSTGTYSVQVKATDVHGAYNFSSSLTVTIQYGGGGCPTLFVWNGSDYVDYGVINIHDVENDVIREVPVQAEDVGVAGYKVKFKLREGWEGLNYSHSLIDQVKLYAVDSEGNHYLCPLIKAEHSEQGKVWLNLLFSDDYRTDTYLMDTIDLTFIMPYPAETIENFTFIIEGHNPLKL